MTSSLQTRKPGCTCVRQIKDARAMLTVTVLRLQTSIAPKECSRVVKGGTSMNEVRSECVWDVETDTSEEKREVAGLEMCVTDASFPEAVRN